MAADPVQLLGRCVVGQQRLVGDRPGLVERRPRRFGMVRGRREIKGREAFERHAVQRGRATGGRTDERNESIPTGGTVHLDAIDAASGLSQQVGAQAVEYCPCPRARHLRVGTAQCVAACQCRGSSLAEQDSAPGLRQLVTQRRATHAGADDDRVPVLLQALCVRVEDPGVSLVRHGRSPRCATGAAAASGVPCLKRTTGLRVLRARAGAPAPTRPMNTAVS